ncbi:MAG: DUF2939 domain-containing protein [Humidesulfovibrio sp.]|nr:DUF2939 domain-containing protein [Humidesulfovibrio sp.]
MRRRMKWMLAGGVLALLMLGGFAFASPYLSVHALRQAAVNKDTATLSEHVDFPAFRQSLKDNFSAWLNEELRKDPKNPLAAIGLMFGGSLVDQLVDAFTTPENLARLVRGHVPQDPASGPMAFAPVLSPGAPAAPSMSVSEAGAAAPPSVSMGYEGVSRFVVRIADHKPGARPLTLEFRRDGLFSWKLCALRLPR